jgi:peroxiredoxin Q/BCP
MTSKPLAPGDTAPAFKLPADGGDELKLSDFKGRTVVLYFYPKDDTAGCTKEALAFSGNIKAFERAGATIIGASKDPVASHDKFKRKHGLAHRLVSDADGSLCEDYGVWVEKSMYGRKYMGIERSTFLIDAKGVVRQVWRKVKVPGHIDEVLAAVKAL